mmetsp:Transcript_41166/g.61702  ORF Transcript_41166/g.61702 Transcript_41166/m.61702 type:complete len:162 (-) Transcript_41166:219-704(-)
MLDKNQAKSWLRCMGWCLPDEELEQMLTATAMGASGAGASATRSGILKTMQKQERTRWGLKHLTDINDANQDKRNSSLARLQTALRRLSNNRAKISRDRLLQFTTMHEDSLLTEEDFNQVLGAIGLTNNKQLDVETLSLKVLDRICDPPSVAEMVDFMPAA